MTSTALISNSATLPKHLQGIAAIGNENIDADVLSTPRLYLLQALSEQVVKGNPNYIKGAQSGMFVNSITDELYEDLYCANLFMTRGYNVNKRREFGQKDWRGFFDTIELANAKLLSDGLNPADYEITDTHTHTLAVINSETGSIITPIQYSMKGTGLKESRTWNTNIVTQGSQLPRFAGIWKLSTKLNSNNKGSWYTAQVVFAGWAPEALYQSLSDLYNNLKGIPAEIPF